MLSCADALFIACLRLSFADEELLDEVEPEIGLPERQEAFDWASCITREAGDAAAPVHIVNLAHLVRCKRKITRVSTGSIRTSILI